MLMDTHFVYTIYPQENVLDLAWIPRLWLQ